MPPLRGGGARPQGLLAQGVRKRPGGKRPPSHGAEDVSGEPFGVGGHGADGGAHLRSIRILIILHKQAQ